MNKSIKLNIKKLRLLLKKNNLDGGPHNKLIKNLAHWLMKEPSLEENEINVSIDKKNIVVNKQFLLEPRNNDLNIDIIDPTGKKHKLVLKKVNNLSYRAIFNFSVSGDHRIAKVFKPFSMFRTLSG